MAGIITVEINCPDDGSAAAIAEALLARRLVASANIHAPIDSLYHWRGRVESAREVPLVLKTRAELLAAVAEAASELHPYELPAIVAQPVVTGDDYRAWVEAETADPS